MKHKILWMGLSFLLAASLVLASCAEEIPGEQEEEEEEEEPAVGEPQYGGTLTWGTLWIMRDETYVNFTPERDVHRSWHHPYLEPLVRADVDKYGRKGTNECSFLTNSYIDEAFTGGGITESWEWAPDASSLTFHLRPGVMWTGNPNIPMEPRELTADDIVFYFEHYMVNPEWLNRGAYDYIDSATATDRYTVVLGTNRYYSDWYYAFSATVTPFPPEFFEPGVNEDDWRNRVGTGPFILTDYVPNSYFKYKANPLFYETTTIDGKEYPLPFVEELIEPVIIDTSTQIAALRTGTLEHHSFVSAEYAATLDETCPGILKVLHNDDESQKITMNCGKPPFNDVNVRRAMWIATDLEAINDAVYFGVGEIHNQPVNPMSGTYIPLEELPAEARELYEYDPDKAKKMLADAGYPEGFPVEVAYTAARPDQEDMISLLQKQWALVGVELIPKPGDYSAVIVPIFRDSGIDDYDGMYMYGWGNDPPLCTMNNNSPRILPFRNHARYYGDEWWIENMEKIYVTLDPAEYAALHRELSIYYVNLALCIVMPQPPVYTYWWPWLKNYRGELNAAHRNEMPFIARTWIDQELKAEMGY